MGKGKQNDDQFASVSQKTRRINKRSKTNVLDGVFILKDLNKSSQIVAEFVPIDRIDKTKVVSIPVYRRDCLYYTPAFSLPYDYGHNYNKKQWILHKNETARAMNQEESQCFRPGTSHEQPYCYICQKSYHQYKDHIKQRKHIKNANKEKQSVCNQYINELCSKQQRERDERNTITTQTYQGEQTKKLSSVSINSIEFEEQLQNHENINIKKSSFEMLQIQHEGGQVQRKIKGSSKKMQSLFDVLEI